MNVVVFLEGGVVQQVITDSENVQVVIVDRKYGKFTKRRHTNNIRRGSLCV
ncbi:hypothetical protein [Niallia circulans]|uniref:hypothetical protein n=1 Tax=Niallia circulans TaxID=1397 RepID=UPI003523A8FF